MQILHTGDVNDLRWDMPDVLLDGLPVLDLLEITPSTDAVARFTQRDQSSVSRIYRQVSRRLGLEFRKRGDGGYRAQANHDLLEHLRCASQSLRLQADAPQPRWILCAPPDQQVVLHLEPPPLPASLQPIDCSEATLGRLLRHRLLDLAVCLRPAAGDRHRGDSHADPLHVDGLQRLRIGRALLLMRSDLQHDPVLEALIAEISDSLRGTAPAAGALQGRGAVWDG
jgi:hypothetical protein